MTIKPPSHYLGFDPRREPYELLSGAARALFDAIAPHLDTLGAGERDTIRKAYRALDALIDALDHEAVFLHWHKCDAENPRTLPPLHHNVLALVGWSKGSHRRFGSMGSSDEEHEAVFYEPRYGHFCTKRDLDNCPLDASDADEIVFVPDHTEGDYEDSDTWCEPPSWWTECATPQDLMLEFLTLPQEPQP